MWTLHVRLLHCTLIWVSGDRLGGQVPYLDMIVPVTVAVGVGVGPRGS